MQNTSKKYTFPLFESVSFKNREFRLAEYHLSRMERSAMKLFGTFSHKNIFEDISPSDYKKDVQYKCRIAYNSQDFNVEFSEYKQKRIEKIKIVEAPDIDYALKYSDRSYLEKLKASYPDYDEILITQKGYICDTSIANVILIKGANLYTPKTCLLEGVQRAYLLDQKLIKQRTIHIDDLSEYDFMMPINAMNGLEEAEKIPTINIEGY